MDVKRKILRNQKGQALVEFVLFFPFMLMMYSVTLSIANSINASINQQKQTRGYFYYRLQNNSTTPMPSRDGGFPSFTRLGMDVTLWGSKVIGNKPVASCFKFNVPLGETEGDDCERGYSGKTTQFIRVGTAYGVCGATYQVENNQVVRLPNYASVAPNEVVGEAACFSR